MKESDFIERNKDKWSDVEKKLNETNISPNDTSRLFVQVTADLSYARTFYKNRSVKIYLNETAKALFNDISRSKNSRLKGFISFWKQDLPLVLYQSRRSMLISFVLFTLCFILGIVSSIHDPDFAKQVLSSDYVNMTNENIAKGDPMAVYKSDSEMRTFLPIFLNNIRIDFVTFFSGLFMSIGTLVIMIVNGVMVGTFQYFFIQKGLFWESFLSIWTHGTIEISTIILSGGAGLTLGQGLLFPGTYSRFHALRISALNGLKIIISVFPLTLLAAFIEGFLTRHTEIPDVIRFLFILISLVFILFYFFWYPRQVAKKTNMKEMMIDADPVFKIEKKFNETEILTTTEIIKITFRTLLKNLGFFLKLVLLSALVYSALIVIDGFNLFYQSQNEFAGEFHYFDYFDYPVLAIISMILVTFVNYKSMIKTHDTLTPESQRASDLQIIFSSFLLMFFSLLLLAVTNDAFKLLACILIPVFSFIQIISINTQTNLLTSFQMMRKLLRKQFSYMVMGILFGFFICFLFIICFNLIFRTLSVDNSIVWTLTSDENIANTLMMGIHIFTTIVSYLLYISIVNIYNSILYFTLKEINTGESMIEKIKQIKVYR